MQALFAPATYPTASTLLNFQTFDQLPERFAAQPTIVERQAAAKANSNKGKRSYVPVELEKRQQLLTIIDNEGLTIKEAAVKLGINYSTAKHIVKTFKRTGTLETQLMKKKKQVEQQNKQDCEFIIEEAAYEPTLKRAKLDLSSLSLNTLPLTPIRCSPRK